jgi:hypothetical protein
MLSAGEETREEASPAPYIQQRVRRERSEMAVEQLSFALTDPPSARCSVPFVVRFRRKRGHR